MPKFIHAADLHLDSPLQGLDRYQDAPLDRIRGATRRAVENLVALAIAERAAFVLIAGDVYDGDWRDYNTGLFFNAQMARLDDAKIQVVVISGNHDAASDVTRSLLPPPNVIRLPTDRAATRLLEDCGVAVHGQGFATKAEVRNLAKGYPDAIPGLLNIGLLHTSVTGRDGHERYAPCDLHDLRSKGYAYWALGHIHKREELLAGGGGGGGEPWVVFPGNVQGRHVREVGGKGASVVEFDANGIRSVTHHDLDVLRWDRLDVDASAAADADEVLVRLDDALRGRLDAAGGRPLAVRVRFVGPCRAHAAMTADADQWQAQVRSTATAVGDGRAWVEQVRVNTSADTVGDVTFDPDGPAADVRAVLDEVRAGGPALDPIAAELADFANRLIAELRTGPDAVAPADLDALRAMIQQLAADELPGLLALPLATGGG